MSLLDFDSEQTLAGLPLQVAVPKESKTSAWTAAPRGVGAAGAEFFADFTSLPQMQQDPADRQAVRFGRMPQIQKDPEDRRKVGEQMTKTARDYAQSLRPDAATASAADMVVFDLSRALTKGAASVVAAGPVLGAGIFGASEGAATLDDMRRKGVDEATAQKVANVTGALSAVGVALPVAGRTIAQSAALVAVGGPGSFAAQQALTRDILRESGNTKLAEQYNPADPLGLGLSLAVPSVFAAAAMRGAARSAAAAPAGRLVETVKEIESNGRRYGNDGELLASPKGALGEMQVMPATARDPGFGIKPWDGKSPDDLARVGRDYLAAMTERYQGDTDKIMAAYNAGPGAVDAQVKARGAAWLEGMPKETRDYVAKGRRKMGAEPVPQEATDAAMVANLRQSREASNPRPADQAAAGRHETAMARAEEQLAAGEPVRVADLVKAEDFVITPAQRDANFQAWFGKSGVVDESGQPKLMYHATQEDITEFRSGLVFTSPDPYFGTGSVDAAAEAMGGMDGLRMMPVYVKGENVFDFENQAHVKALRLKPKMLDAIQQPENWIAIEQSEIQAAIKKAGFDGFYVREGGVKNLAVFEASQVKSAIGNSGRFDPNSPSLTDPIENFGAALREVAAAKTADDVPVSPGPGADAPTFQAARLADGATTPATQAEASAVNDRLDAIRADFPDLMVQMDGMDAPMQMDDFLAAVKADADEMLADAPLLQRAAECAIINGL